VPDRSALPAKNTISKVNNAHNGKRLGGALFKVLYPVGIAHKVCSGLFLQSVWLYGPQLGHVTCDNASNNGTMLQEFARLYQARYKKEFPWREHKIKSLTILPHCDYALLMIVFDLVVKHTSSTSEHKS
jgi:hypothetical protein